MTDRDQFEEDAIRAVQDEVTAALPVLRSRGLSVGSLQVSRGGEGDEYVSELRLYVFRDGQICDALEVPMWRRGTTAATVDELRDWFRSELAALES